MSGGRVAMLIAGILLALVGFGMAVGGGGMLLAGAVQGEEGYLSSPDFALTTDTHALRTEAVHLDAPRPGGWVPWVGRFEARLTVEAADGGAVFVGVAPTEEVDAYLEGVGHVEVTELGTQPDATTYAERFGSAAPEPPTQQDFWVASAEGAGQQQLRWAAEPGVWTVVVMNPDAAPGLTVVASAATPANLLSAVGAGLLVGGVILLAAAVVLIIAATNRAFSRPAAPDAATQPARRRGAPAAYPLQLTARLDEPLNRGLWLVKWLLVIPHVIVLAFLWLAFAVLTFAAGVAILFSGRYPRGLFDINVGILRWTWRVAYYSYSALGTDAYPPFTLQPADHPATLDVEYPERLSRGLVLVKWWLLALPHYLIVGVLAGGGTYVATTRGGDAWTVGGSGGLIGLLVVIAGVALLFTGRYPHGLFDLIMGLNRWVYRVIAYAALMTDRYPPFRLDAGGEEPRPAPPLPAPPSGGTTGAQELTPA